MKAEVVGKLVHDIYEECEKRVAGTDRDFEISLRGSCSTLVSFVISIRTDNNLLVQARFRRAYGIEHLVKSVDVYVEHCVQVLFEDIDKELRKLQEEDQRVLNRMAKNKAQAKTVTENETRYLVVGSDLWGRCSMADDKDVMYLHKVTWIGEDIVVASLTMEPGAPTTIVEVLRKNVFWNASAGRREFAGFPMGR